jgi:hypothetical protein
MALKPQLLGCIHESTRELSMSEISHWPSDADNFKAKMNAGTLTLLGKDTSRISVFLFESSVTEIFIKFSLHITT